MLHGNHVGSHALMARYFGLATFGPTMKQDCLEFVHRYDKCQRFGELKHTPSEQLHCLETSQPFHKWGIDILYPFPLAPEQLKYLVIVIDYFTKQIEVEPLPMITIEMVRKFVWKRITYRYEVPHHLFSDNRTQFIDQ